MKKILNGHDRFTVKDGLVQDGTFENDHFIE